jgi:hypothetical protein
MRRDLPFETWNFSGGRRSGSLLQDAGLACSIYEASPIVGGRIHSNASTWAENQTSEWCGEFHTGWWMESIRKKADGTFSLTFGTPQGAREVTADHVISTVPFGVLARTRSWRCNAPWPGIENLRMEGGATEGARAAQEIIDDLS